MEDVEVAVVELELESDVVGTVTEDWLVVVSVCVVVEEVSVVEVVVVGGGLVVELSVVELVVGIETGGEVSVVCVVVSFAGPFCLFPSSAILCAGSPSW